MASKNKKKKDNISLNIWVSCCNFKVTVGQIVGALAVPKNQFLFLIGENGEYLLFKDESGKKLQIHKKAIDAGHIKRVF